MLKASLKSGQSAFSLIELLIGIAILGISLSLAMPSYRTWIQNTQIRNTAESMQNGMQKARAEAVSRNTNVSFVLGGGAFWTITDLGTAQVIETRPSEDASTNITITTAPAASTTITLNNMGGVTGNADASATLRLVTIDSTMLPAADSRDLKITVGTGGTCSVDGVGCVGSVIRMCDPNVAATTDPRHC